MEAPVVEIRRTAAENELRETPTNPSYHKTQLRKDDKHACTYIILVVIF